MPDGRPDDRAPALARVTRLRSIRTLVVGRDLAFRARSLAVLGDLGPVAFVVSAPDALDGVLELVEREQPHVLVLDATACAPRVARVVDGLRELAPGVGVVAVSDPGDLEARSLPALPKWGWAAELSRAVEEAARYGAPTGPPPSRRSGEEPLRAR